MSGYLFHTSLVPAMTVSSEDVQNADTAYVVYDMYAGTRHMLGKAKSLYACKSGMP